MMPRAADAAGEEPLTREAERAVLAAGCRELGLAPAPDELERLLALVDELETANAHFNLTAIRDRPGMLRKHVLDSLTVYPFLGGARIADVGTGAGFPGLPLAILSPARGFTLIEATGKKARYVAGVAERLKVRNVEVVNERAERYRPASRFDTVVARALGPLAEFVRQAAHLCAPGGRLLAMKGRRPDAEIAALPGSVRLVAVHRVRVPGLDDERHIVELSPVGARSP